MKTPKQLERYMKGVASHRRIEILFLIDKESNCTLEDISEKLECSFSTISTHTRSLLHAGLLNKQYKGRFVLHSLSPFGRKVMNLLKSF